MGAILRLVRDAHARMCPAVPLVGWDVALTTEGTCLLEANLSCNFFRASFDKQASVRGIAVTQTLTLP